VTALREFAVGQRENVGYGAVLDDDNRPLNNVVGRIEPSGCEYCAHRSGYREHARSACQFCVLP